LKKMSKSVPQARKKVDIKGKQDESGGKPAKNARRRTTKKSGTQSHRILKGDLKKKTTWKREDRIRPLRGIQSLVFKDGNATLNMSA